MSKNGFNYLIKLKSPCGLVKYIYLADLAPNGNNVMLQQKLDDIVNFYEPLNYKFSTVFLEDIMDEPRTEFYTEEYFDEYYKKILKNK